MKQEDKDLLLADLCARLPYNNLKVRGVFFNYNKDINRCQYEVCDREFKYDDLKRYETLKPYLFPLSSMTLEQRCKVQSLLPDKCTISFTNSKFEFYGEDYHEIKLEQFEKIFNLFNMWHFDYRGLIPIGLALDATNLNIY